MMAVRSLSQGPPVRFHFVKVGLYPCSRSCVDSTSSLSDLVFSVSPPFNTLGLFVGSPTPISSVCCFYEAESADEEEPPHWHPLLPAG